MIAYQGGNRDLRYVHAGDAPGSTWRNPVAVNDTDTVGVAMTVEIDVR